jgi:hypothetical protein
VNPSLESILAGLVLGLALFALLACTPERLKERYLPEQFAAVGPQ